MMKVPLFDLDDTLVYGGPKDKVHKDSYDFALHSVYNLPDATHNEIIIHGMVDTQILVTVAKRHGMNEEDAVSRLPKAMHVMVDYFENHIHEQPSTPEPGVKALLETLHNQVHCGVLTGNVETIAWHKLEQAGLKKYISFGAFGNMAMKRVELIPIAHKKYEEKFGQKRPVSDFVILGDTPKDILCAKEGGISVIAIATGNYTKEELKKEHPDIVLESLEEKEKIISFLQNS